MFVVDRHLLKHVLLANFLDFVHVLHVKWGAGSVHSRVLEFCQIEGLLIVLHHIENRCQNQAD